MSINRLVQHATVVLIVASPLMLGGSRTFAQSAPPIWTVPEVGALPDDAASRQIKRGRDLITATYAHIGPEVPNPGQRYAGNNLACGNCHLNAGTKKFGIPLDRKSTRLNS